VFDPVVEPDHWDSPEAERVVRSQDPLFTKTNHEALGEGNPPRPSG